MNKFEYTCVIDGAKYDFYIDSSHDDNKTIRINGVLAFEENYTLSLNRKAYMIYYPLTIGEHTVVVSINDNPLQHEYDIFIDDVSIINGKSLTEKYDIAKAILDRGIGNFVKNKFFEVLIDNLLFVITATLAMGFISNYAAEGISMRVLLSFLIIPVLMPLLLFVEWKHNVNIVKKYKQCFRPKKKIKRMSDGSVRISHSNTE